MFLGMFAIWINLNVTILINMVHVFVNYSMGIFPATKLLKLTIIGKVVKVRLVNY